MLNSASRDKGQGLSSGRSDGRTGMRAGASGRAGTLGRQASALRSGESEGGIGRADATDERHYWLVPVDQGPVQ